MACPQGDGQTLASKGLTISIQVLDPTTLQPVAGIPANQIWLVGAHDGLTLCGGSAATHADAATDANGRTTFSGALAVGGCDDGLYVVVQGLILANPNGCDQLIVVPIAVHSVDINGNGTVNGPDFAQFGVWYQNGVYDACADFNGDGQDSGPDFSMFAFHYQNGNGHHCP